MYSEYPIGVPKYLAKYTLVELTKQVKPIMLYTYYYQLVALAYLEMEVQVILP